MDDKVADPLLWALFAVGIAWITCGCLVTRRAKNQARKRSPRPDRPHGEPDQQFSTAA